ncbi:hypothetical protein EXIGLDRAFT_782101 [Exidia glandulosa HHB12029]|uniref:DUF6534 domain-containing protein n=1 Tax=Exidia glandulosa HHB12029 TaxID=1314781 RepID=A0A165B083_EXIGL|nr:hypothetical protein EXIGLDRAFT_782101 [Exidia glandulosa HHB12029]
MTTSPFVSLFGSLEIGMALGMFLSGMIMLQVSSYFRNYSSDRLGLRCLVGVIQYVPFNAADTAATCPKQIRRYPSLHCSDSHGLHVYHNPLRRLRRSDVVWSMKAISIILGVNIAIVHAFFLLRMYTLTKSIVLVLITSALAVTRLVVCVFQMVTLFRATSLDFIHGTAFRWEVSTLDSVGAASDVLVAASICWALLHMRRGLPKSNKLIDRLIAFTVGSGLLTGLVGVLETVLYLSLRGYVFALFAGILPKLFSVSLLTSLNERQNNQRQLDPTSVSGPLSVTIEMVVLIQIIDLLHSMVLIHMVYTYTILYFGQVESAGRVVWSFKATAMILGLNIGVVHMFFVMRVYTLTKSTVLFVGTAVLATGRLAIHFRQMVTVFSGMTFDFLRTATFRWEVTSLLAVGAAADVLIAASICRALLRMRSGLSSSNKLVDKLVAFTIGGKSASVLGLRSLEGIGSGLMTSVIAVLELILYLAVPGFAFLLFFVILGKLFSVSLLTSLNERKNNRRTLDPNTGRALSVTIEMRRGQFTCEDNGNPPVYFEEPHDKSQGV